MQRTLLESLREHYLKDRQMLFVSGPGQVGKTTIARQLGDVFPVGAYFNWDNPSHRMAILDGAEEIASRLHTLHLR